MLRTKSLAALLMGTALLSLPRFPRGWPGKQIEASAQFSGTFLKQTDSNGVRQTSSDSGGILASYRFFFTRHQVSKSITATREHAELRLRRRTIRDERNQH